MATATRANYRLGTMYALATAGLMAVQSPFSSLAAKSLSSPLFVCFTQIALLAAVPLLISRADSRREFCALSGFSIGGILRSRWIYAIPMPIFFALSGTLIFKWFPDTDESAVIAANFLVSTVILIPTTLIIAKMGPPSPMYDRPEMAILLLLVGTLASSAAGRVFYQVALSATQDDNGFVSMFLLLVPGIASLLCYPLSLWIPELRVAPTPTFFIGLALVTIPLAVFSLKSSSGGAALVQLDAPTTPGGDDPVASAAVLP
jgi:hypothetical protein